MTKQENPQNTQTFTVTHVWNGRPLKVAEYAHIKAQWLANGDLALQVDAPFANDPKPVCENNACWALWNYEVVELFLVGEGSPAPYTEIEISPWGHHLVLQLLGERNTVAKALPLTLEVTRSEKRWSANAVLSASLIPKGTLRINAYRIHGVEPERQYHVMTPLATEQPDFHRIDRFIEILQRS